MAIQFGRTATLVAVNKKKNKEQTNDKIVIDAGLRGDASEGFEESFRVSFNIQKSGVALNTAEISFYNLDQPTIDFLSSTDVSIEFYAGYLDNKNLLFKGKITSVTNERNAPDHITTIYSSSGLTSTQSSFSNTVVKKDESVADAVKKLLRDITDLQTGFVDKLPECKKWVRSQTISGDTFEILDRLGSECGFTLNVDDDKVSIYKKDYTPTTDKVTIITPNTGLLGIPSSTEIGVDFVAMLNPDLKPFAGVQIESDSFTLGVSNASFYNSTIFKNGRYGILTVNYMGDTNGNDWVAKCKTQYWGATIEWKT